MGKKGKFEFDAGNFLAYVLKKFKLLVGISIAAAIVAAICSLFLKNMYLSEANLVPTSQTNVPRALLDINYGYAKGDLMSAGLDEDVDLLLQVLNSGDLFIGINKKFDLGKHYKLDPTSKSFKYKLYKSFYSNVKFSRTEFTTVSVKFWDEDPVFAYQIANEIIKQVDTVFNRMQRDRIVESMVAVRAEYDSMKLVVNKLQDSLLILGKMGVFDISSQTQELTRAYYKALMKGRPDIAKNIQTRLDVIGKNGGRITDLYYKIDKYDRNIADFELKLSIARAALKQNVTHVYVANRPGISDYKDYPKRSIIVLVAAIAAFFTALFAFIIVDNIKKLQ